MVKINENHREVMEIIMSLSQGVRCCRQDAAFCEGVTFHQFIILDAVAKAIELNMADLHEILSVEKSTTTRLVNPLIQKGLLQRGRAEHDSRAIKLMLTKEGKDVHKKVWLCVGDFFQNVIQNVPKAKRGKVLESVKIFIKALKSATAACNCCE